MRRGIQRIVLSAILFLSVAPADAGVDAGCCRCTGCASAELFVCRDTLDESACATACTNLGCASPQFNAGSGCVDLAQCYGDCCDDLDGSCNQVPQASCTGGKQYFAASFCDGSNCVAEPPTPTVTSTATVTATSAPSSTPTDTPTVVPSATHTATPPATTTATPPETDTPTPMPTDTATAAPTETSTAAPSETSTPLPTDTATPPATETGTASASETPTPTPPPMETPTPTIPADNSFSWVVDGTEVTKELVGIPVGGATYGEAEPLSLALFDDLARFCSTPGLLPQLRLDAPASACENECFLGIYPNVLAGRVQIARLPAITGEQRTFDLLIETPPECMSGQPPITLRMANAIVYTDCVGDCDADGAVSLEEIELGITAALGQTSVSACRAEDRSGDGAITVDELVTAVNSRVAGACVS